MANGANESSFETYKAPFVPKDPVRTKGNENDRGSWQVNRTVSYCRLWFSYTLQVQPVSGALPPSTL